jgi:hypothetical protein
VPRKTGNADSALTVLGMIVGAGIGHNFGIAAKADAAGVVGGPGNCGKVAVIVGLVICIVVGLLCREKPPQATR